MSNKTGNTRQNRLKAQHSAIVKTLASQKCQNHVSEAFDFKFEGPTKQVLSGVQKRKRNQAKALRKKFS